ncbi:frataxin, mitochondrial-like [Bidens hawaiensis]|uniref:frataxin, mitochondrial-like n=1 Tax=Bidens hawaiensis TaxID=980011 RepID=UPI00404905BA
MVNWSRAAQLSSISPLQPNFLLIRQEYGDAVDIDGFDIDYGNQVLTVKFGSLGTYVLNKQTPNRQIWMSSPVSGPSRFDWDQTAEAWIYRRTKAKLLETLESEIQQLYCKDFCSRTSNLDTRGPAAIDYSALLHEEEFHKLADSTILHLLDKIEEYGDAVDIDGFDIDYGNQVLTVKFGSLGTYVLNKQTPNRQIWMSSPVSGPSRFDWDQTAEAWIYRRTKAKLLETLESEIQQLCGEPIKLC